MVTFVQEMADRILRRAEIENPGVYYTLHLSPANSLLLPRTDTMWDRGGFRVANRDVYGDALVLPLRSMDDATIQAAPIFGLPEAVTPETADGYVGDLGTGIISTVETPAPQ